MIQQIFDKYDFDIKSIRQKRNIKYYCINYKNIYSYKFKYDVSDNKMFIDTDYLKTNVKFLPFLYITSYVNTSHPVKSKAKGVYFAQPWYSDNWNIEFLLVHFKYRNRNIKKEMLDLLECFLEYKNMFFDGDNFYLRYMLK